MAFFDKALAPLRDRVDRHPQPPSNLGVLLAVGGGQHDPGPHHLTLLGGRPPQPALQHPPLAGGQGDRKRAGAAHERLTTSSPPGVVAAPTLTATASSRLARSSVVERLACSTATAAATSRDTRPASAIPAPPRPAQPARSGYRPRPAPPAPPPRPRRDRPRRWWRAAALGPG